MSIPPPNPPSPSDDDLNQPKLPGAFSQDVQYSQVTARVPERIGRGVASTGAIVLQGPHEFVIDFIQRLTQPHQLLARVVVPHTIMPGFIAALQENLNNYTQRFGPPPALPPIPPNVPMPRIDEVYEQIKLPDESLVPAYANAVMIVHSPAEFCLDFIANIYPRSVVTARVFLSAFHVPRVLESLKRSFEQFQRKLSGALPHPPPPPPQQPPPPPASPTGM
jgi:hypothetical protein